MDRGEARCPLCQEGGGLPPAALEIGGKVYHDCSACGLLWMAPAHHLSAEAERARYETHRNLPDDPGYRGFLNRLAEPLLDRLPPLAEGLDFGSGPGPTLSLMLAEAGHPIRLYDPFFAPFPESLERRYDFVTCTETVEHFRSPRAAFDQLAGLLRPQGWLAIMTQPFTADLHFPAWWYIRDPTHVSFYRLRTMEWIAHTYRWSLERPHPSVFLFHVP
jgi:hypothetical protein